MIHQKLKLAVSVALLLAVPRIGYSQWGSLNGGVDHFVRGFTISPDSSKLLVCGSFPHVLQDSLRANSLAYWDGANWTIEGLAGGNGDTSPAGNSNPIYNAVFRGDTLFVGHLLSYWHGDAAMGKAAMLVGDTWQPCGSPENWFFMLEANGRLFNGGRSDTLYGTYMPMVNEWRDHQWQPLPNSPFDNTGTIYDATYWNDKYIFAGSFNVLGCRKIIAYDPETHLWEPLMPGVGGLHISKVIGYGDSLYVGGYFLPGPDVVSKHIQIWDGVQWQPFFPDLVQMYGQVIDLKVHEGALYLSGNYQFIGDATLYGILRYDGHQLCAIGGEMPAGSGPIAFFQDYLYNGLPPMHPDPFYEFIGRLPLDVVPDVCVEVAPVGIQEAQAPLPLQIYPNPGNTTISIQLGRKMPGEVLVQVFNALGQKVIEQNTLTGAEVITVNVATLAQGTYTVALDMAGVRSIARFVKQ